MTPPPNTAEQTSPDAGRPISVLVVDDNAKTAGVLDKLLRVDGFRVEVFADAMTAMLRLDPRFVPDVLVMDVSPGRADELGVRRICARYPASALILVTAHPQQAEALARGAARPCQVVTKPIDYPQFVGLLHSAITGCVDPQLGFAGAPMAHRRP